MQKSAIPSRTVLLSAFLVAAAACEPSAKTRQQIAELQAASAQKDSLVEEVAANARIMSEIGAEVARAQGAPVAGPGGERLGAPANPDTIMAGIRSLSARLDSTQVLLTRSEARAKDLSGQAGGLRRSIADLRAAVNNQKATVTALTEQVATLQAENTRLTGENTELSAANQLLGDTVQALSTRAAKVYYVVGTKEDLLQRGIIKETGGSRVLFVFGKRGQVLVPAADMDPNYFTPIDMRNTMEIQLPHPDRTYRIVTPQDLSALSNTPDEKGRIQDSALRIVDAQRFWANSRYLILVES